MARKWLAWGTTLAVAASMVGALLLPAATALPTPAARPLDQPSATTADPASGPCLKFCVGWGVGGSADGYGVILRTDDGGVTWQRQGQVGDIPDVNLQGVSAADDQHAWAVGEGVILHTRDGGQTWKAQELPPGLPPDLGLLQVKALGPHLAFAVGGPSVLLRTTRRTQPGQGPQWVQMPTGPHLPSILFTDVDALSPTEVWAVGGVIAGSDARTGLAITHYTGRKWRPQLITHPPTSVCSAMIGVSVLDAQTAWAVGGEDCPPYRTVDGGATWEAVGGPVVPGSFDTNKVVAVTQDLIWITHDNGIFRSINGGADWQQTPGCSGGRFCYALSAATRFAWASSMGVPPGEVFRWVHNHWDGQAIPATSSIVTISMVGARR